MPHDIFNFAERIKAIEIADHLINHSIVYCIYRLLERKLYEAVADIAFLDIA